MGIASSSSNPESRAMALAKAKEIVASAPLVVFSKTSCPFCVSVKQLFEKLGASYKAIELNVESDGPELQNALKEWTGQRTVPNVFINGKHIGGCDDTMALNNNGKLVPLLTESGAIASSASSNPALAKAKEVVASTPLVVFSKTSCPFCVRVKQLFEKLGASYKAIVLDVESDGPELQNALKEWTGQSTVPNVFINGKHIGGCDDTMALNNNGKLVPLLTESGAIASSASSNPALAKAKEVVASAPLVVFSKTSCPFCVRVKQLFEKLGASYKAIELDVESDGPELQNALEEWTGQRTVPNVFINGKHIGGCDDTMALNNNGELVPLLTEAGAIAGSISETTVTA